MIALYYMFMIGGVMAILFGLYACINMLWALHKEKKQ